MYKYDIGFSINCFDVQTGAKVRFAVIALNDEKANGDKIVVHDYLHQEIDLNEDKKHWKESSVIAYDVLNNYDFNYNKWSSKEIHKILLLSLLLTLRNKIPLL